MLDVGVLIDRLPERVRLDYCSPRLCIATGPSAQIQAVAGKVRTTGGIGVRYYLSAGVGRFRRPPWCLGQRAARSGVPQVDWILVENIVNSRQNRHVAADREVAVVDGAARLGPTMLVMEALGAPSRDDVVFLQACQLALAPYPAGRSRLLVLRHETDPRPDREPPGGQEVEVLLALLLAGGYAHASDFQRWSRLRAWDSTTVASCTSTRILGRSTVYTYAGAAHREGARVALTAADPGLLADLAAVVSSGQPEPLTATAVLAAEPDAALVSFARLAHGPEDSVHDVLAYGRSLLREGRRGGWTRMSKRTAGTLVLAALVAQPDRVSAETVPVLLNLAERFEVDPEVRVGLAYCAGQHLAKKRDARSWAASLRCFEYAQRCMLAYPSTDPDRDGSRMAAIRNGKALALFRAGDHRAAVAAELAGLDDLATLRGPDRDQQILLLSNMATVHRSGVADGARARACYRRAWRLACAGESVAGMAYVAPDLVRNLLADARAGEAHEVARAFLGLAARTGDSSRAVERAIVSVCCSLAEAETGGAAGHWYLEAVRRMRRSAPRMVEAVLDNLSLRPGTPPETIRQLRGELSRHQATAQDLAALAALLERGDDSA